MRSSTLAVFVGLLAFAAAGSSFVHIYAPVFNIADPSGTYAGSKTILGQSVKASMVFASSSKVNFAVSGPVEINCDNEDFVYEASSGLISFPDINTKGDCMHDALSKYSATLQSVKYDGSADHITVAIKVSIVTVNIELDHKSQGEVLRHPEVVFAPAPPSPPLAELVTRYYDVYASASPSGTSKGSKTVLGLEIDAKIVVTKSYFSLIISGAEDIECDDEPYTYANDVITITNANKPGDCIHDNMQNNDIALEAITYDPSSDSITVKVKVEGFLGVDFVLDKSQGEPAAVDFDALVDRYLSLVDLADPSGTYEGSKSVLGQTVSITVSTEANSQFSIDITGPSPISCDHEPYSYSDGVLTPTNIGKKGDCLHDAFEANDITLESIEYDSSADVITINVKYTIFKLSVELKHKSASQLVHRAPQAPVSKGYSLPMLYNNYYKLFLLQDPAGSYKGSKTILGQNVDATIVIKSADVLEFDVSGLVTVTCDSEDYSYSSGVITFPNVGKSGDCLHDALDSNSVTLKSITYDTSSDAIVAELKKSFLTVSMTLNHVV